MTLSLALACIWLIVANVIAILPTRDKHWTSAYVLMAAGVPLLAFVVYQNGLVWGIGLLIAGGWILKWPVYYLFRWIARKLGLRKDAG